jgi:ATP-dependent protease ClpP protease subunit
MSDLLLYGAIGWDVMALDVVREVSKAKGEKLTVRVNSPGGYVWEGLAIANAIKGHGNTTTHVDGLAASMGSVIFLAGKKRLMATGSRLMIHNPTSYAGGEANDLRAEADVLDGIANDMAAMYSEVTGGKVSVDKAREMMDAETWLSPDEAVALGFAHGIEGKAAAFAKIPESMKFKHAPQEATVPTPENEPSLLERMLAKVNGTSEIKADLAKAEGALSEAVAKIADAEGRATAAEARASEAVAALEAANTAHALALTEAVAAAKIEGAQEFAAHNLKVSAPDGMSHVEEGDLETFTTHTAKEKALRESGRLQEAAAYYSAHKKEIFAGE